MAPCLDERPRVLIEYDIAVPMRDGVELAGDLYRSATGRPTGTILQRTPYGKSVTEHLDYSFDLLRAVREGWHVFVQDVRGRGLSGGTFDPFRREIDDGEDTLAWIEAQTWSDGNVVMAGGSYCGATQWLAALSGHASLRALAPALTPDDYYDGWVFDGGAPRQGFVAHWIYESLWAELAGRSRVVAPKAAVRAELADALTPPGQSWGPWARLAAPFLDTWDAHPTRDAYWTSVSPRDNIAQVDAPAFVIAGWFDVFGRRAIDSFVRLRSAGSSERVRQGTRLVVGPWTHGQFAGTYADVDFGPDASARSIDLSGLQLRWFADAVQGPDGRDDGPAVRAFVMGVNEWRAYDAWPPEQTIALTLDLGFGPAALGVVGASVGECVIEHDSSDPVPTVGGATFLRGRHLAINAGPRSQHALDTRVDILRFEGARLSEELHIIGRVEVCLNVSCDDDDATVTARLVIVEPNGTSWGLVDGVRRLSHRNGDDAPSPAEPGMVYRVPLDLGHTAVVVGVGARLRLDVASSNFPHVADVDASASGPRSRRLVVHCGPDRSKLVLDVMPRHTP